MLPPEDLLPIPLVDTLPADGSSSPLVFYNGVVYLWGKVIELNGPDQAIFTPPLATLISGAWSVHFSLNDRSADFSYHSWGIVFRNAASQPSLAISIRNNNTYRLTLYNGVTTIRYVDFLTPHIPNIPIKFSIGFDGVRIFATCKSEIVSIDNFTGWTESVVTTFRFTDDSVSIRPLEICNILAYASGVLLDGYPCDDGTGTSVRNIVTPARAGSLSDPLAWGMGWRATT